MTLSKCPLEGWIFGAQRAKNETPPVTPKLKLREVSQSGFWNISLYPTSVPSFSQIGWPQLLAPGTLSQTMTLKCFWWSTQVLSGCFRSLVRRGVDIVEWFTICYFSILQNIWVFCKDGWRKHKIVWYTEFPYLPFGQHPAMPLLVLVNDLTWHAFDCYTYHQTFTASPENVSSVNNYILF